MSFVGFVLGFGAICMVFVPAYASCVIGGTAVKRVFLPLNIRFHPGYIAKQKDGVVCFAEIGTINGYQVNVYASLRKYGEPPIKAIEANFIYPVGTRLPREGKWIHLKSIPGQKAASLSYELDQLRSEVSNFRFQVGDDIIECPALKYFGDDCGDGPKRAGAKK